MRLSYFLIIFILHATAFAQHAEVNLIEGTSYNKFIDYQIKNFERRNKVNGFCFILAHKGRVVYSKAVGFADDKKRVKLTLNQPQYMLKATRLYTVMGIMKLLQEGKVSLEDNLFGPNSIFEKDLKHKFGPNMQQITVRQMLEMTTSLSSQIVDSLYKELTDDTKVKKVARPIIYQLSYTVGLHTRENPETYMLLDAIIQKLAEKPYKEYVTEITKDFRLNDLTFVTPKDRNFKQLNSRINYRKYYTYYPAYYNAVSSPGDMMNLLLWLDGIPDQKELLQHQAIRIMQVPSKINPKKGKGWDIDENGFYIFTSSGLNTNYLRIMPNGISYVFTTFGPAKNENVKSFPDKILHRIRKLP